MFRKTIIGLVLACVGCCAIPFLIPALAGIGIFGGSLFGKPISLEAIICALPIPLLVALVIYMVIKAIRQRTRSSCQKDSCQADGKCGCKS
jgi:hypothetical protein